MFLVPKLLYVCLYSLYGSAIAYLAIFYSESLHLSSNQIGIILAIAPFVQVVACPLWTVIADKYPKLHGPLMGILAGIGGSSVLALYYLPLWININDTSTNEQVMVITAVCASIFAFFGSPICALVDSAVLKILGDQKLLYGNQRLWGSVSNGIHILVVGLLIAQYDINISFVVFALGLVSFVILSILFVHFDYHMISKEDNNINTTHDPNDVIHNTSADSEEEDEERRSLLAGKSSSVAGTNYMYDPSTTTWSHQQQRPSYSSRRQSQQSHQTRRESIANTLYLLDDQMQYNELTNINTSIMAMDVQMEANELLQATNSYPSLGLVLSYIPTIDTSMSAFATLLQDHVYQEQENIPDKSILKSLLVYTFMISILLYGIAHSMISQFLFLLLKDLGMDPFIIGWTGPIGGIAEVITFWLSRQLFDKYSVTLLMTLALLSFMFRALVYTCLTAHETRSIIFALLLQIINGFAYALVWSTAVAEVDSFFPVEQRSIAQGILAALFSGLGYGIGCILGGYIYGVYGFSKLFQVSTIICGISLVVFLSGRRRTMT
ncbi:major facilitator superfamily domain-containing protein [Thamnidium elegans]|nr:major facilitator superfamily domain-containing protein [Thamnidium elegans]